MLLFILCGAHDWLFFYDTGLCDVLVSVADLEGVKGVHLKPPPSPPPLSGANLLINTKI